MGRSATRPETISRPPRAMPQPSPRDRAMTTNEDLP